VQVQGFGTTSTTFKVFGFFDMQNTGTAPAYLGNLVINLQSKKGGTQFATVASDIINSTAQDAATTAFTCGGASTDGTTSVYLEGLGSGTLQLYNPDNNDLVSFPAQLDVNQRMTFLYEATFDLAALNINPGDQIRVEALVTFSNAGPRGGSGASCTNTNVAFGTTDINKFRDINGDGTYTNDELYYRTVPCRISFTVPALEHHNKNVTLNDVVSNAQDQPVVHDLIVGQNGVDLFDQSAGLTPVNLVGSLTVTDAKTNIGTIDGNGYGSGIATYTGNGPHLYGVNTVQATMTITPDDTGNALVGLDNCATLIGDAQDDIVTLTDPNSTNTYTFTCATATNLKACAWPLFPVIPPPHQGSACTYTQGGWGGKVNNKGHNPAWYLSTYWSTVYPSGSVTVGGNGGPYTMTFHGGTTTNEVCIANCNGKPSNKVFQTVTVTYTGADKVMAFLPAKGGTPGVLNETLDNPTESHAGEFGGQVLTLQLGVDFGDKGVGWAVTSPVGDVIYAGTGCEAGRKIRDILADANRVLGGGSLPAGCTFSDLNTIVAGINEAYDECKSISPAMASGGLTFTDN
jgi:hypothetical protein